MYHKILAHTLGLLLSTMIVTTGYCDPAQQSLQTKLNNIKTMSANFEQSTKTRKRALTHSSGTMALSRPGHLRWQTQKPHAQLTVADGRRLWIYDPELEQVSVRRQGAGLGGIAGLFLTGYHQQIAREFNVLAIPQGRRTVYDLRPKQGKSGFVRVKLVFDGTLLTQIDLYDQLGQYTKISLHHIKLNTAISPGLFRFKAPKGTDVVNQ